MAGLPLLLLDRISPLICPLGVIQLSRECRLADSTTDVDDDRAQMSHVPLLTRCLRFVSPPG
jgi:hypothetical protein